MIFKFVSLLVLTFTLTNTLGAKENNVFNASLSGQGDNISLFENYYDEGQGFVYTADVHFKEGQAAGLAFGGKEDESAYVFNFDRIENKVKLLYFTKETTWKANELYSAPFIGNDKTTAGEYSLINPKVRTIEKVNLKVIVSYNEGNPFVECYADNIVRFDIDNALALTNYTGGYLGLNVFSSSVELDNVEIGKSDYSYYTELYRNQYHFSQFAHWNNDPNGLVYYNGYYHLYYQHHPYSQFWSDMYWGHARSKDLLHWQHLPICLFPDTEGDFGPGNGMMWSGSAMVYRKGMSELIDSYNWFPNGEGEGLIAYYTRDGGYQDQVIMSSDDEGLTWTKRVRIPQTICVDNGRQDCRDPELFPVKKEGDKVTMWGMILSGVSTQTCWFLKSTDLINWTLAGSFNMFYPECISIIDEEDKDGNVRQIIMFSSRYYIVGNIKYNETTEEIEFIDLSNRSLSTYTADTLPLETMDYAKDSYASQAFSIDDESSEYYGLDVSLNWFSGVPSNKESCESGLFHQVRTNWNGGGMTIPVVLGLNDNYELTQKPITVDNDKLNKTNIINETNVEYDSSSENILEDVSTHIFEMDLDIENPLKADVAIRVNIGEDEYTEIGWNSNDGYYVDRTNTSDAGISFTNFGFDNYHLKYASNIGKNDTNIDFYILSDNGSLEVFARDYSVPFYVLTVASPYSIGASISVSDKVNITNLQLNEIGTVWRDDVDSEEGVLYISNDDVYLDTTLTNEKDISVYYTGGGALNYTLQSGEDVVEINPISTGVNIKALKEGNASILVDATNKSKVINVTIKTGSPNIDIALDKSSIISGDWIMSSDGLEGNASGDGFIISSTEGSNFIYSALIDSSSATAAALVFRANKDLSSYIVANYDKALGIVKLWSHKGVLMEKGISVDASSYLLGVQASGMNISVSINGNEVINVDLDSSMPSKGYFGLNVYNGKAIFNDIVLSSSAYTYEGGDLSIELPSEQHVLAIYNVTNKNTLVHEDFYVVENNNLIIKEDYFKLIENIGLYTFKIEGSLSVLNIDVDIKYIPVIDYNDRTIEYGSNLVIYIGHNPIEKVEVNETVLSDNDYQLNGHMLIISYEVFKIGNNIVKINQAIEINVNVMSLPTTTDSEGNNLEFNYLNNGTLISLLICGGVMFIVILIVSIILITRWKRKYYGG